MNTFKRANIMALAAITGLFAATNVFASTSSADSNITTVDTRTVLIGSATISGMVLAENGAGLTATVTALQNGVVRAQTVANSLGVYTLTSLPEGTYLVQAAKTGYLPVNRYGVSLSANQAV